MDKNDGKNYRLVVRMLNAASAYDISVDTNDGVYLGDLNSYIDSEIIGSEDGNKILDILGSLEVGCV